MKSDKKYSTIILSAGKSTRMGVPKFSLKFNKTTTFLENIINEYSTFGCEEIVVVLNPDSVAFLEQLKLKFPRNIKIAINEHPEWERFYSIKIGAKSLNSVIPVFISNIDNPFVNKKVIESLALSSESADYVYPIFNGKGGHPFLLSAKVITDLSTEDKDQIHLKEFLGRYSKNTVEVNDEKILANINTHEEYRRFFNH